MVKRNANVNVHVELDIKEQAKAIREKIGVSTSTFIMLAGDAALPVAVPKRPKARDTMTYAEFNAMMTKGLWQAKAGENAPVEDAINNIMKRLG